MRNMTTCELKALLGPLLQHLVVDGDDCVSDYQNECLEALAIEAQRDNPRKAESLRIIADLAGMPSWALRRSAQERMK